MFGKKYNDTEDVPGNVCPHCRKKKITRSGMGTCGGRKCLQEENARAIYDGDFGTRYQSGGGQKVRIDGKGKQLKVLTSKTIKGTHCYVLADGKERITVPIDRCK